MTDSYSSVTMREATAATPQQNANKIRDQPVRPASATTIRQANFTHSPHARTGSASNSKAANSTPRGRARPVGASRSLSTPLTRSLSNRGPRVKDRRWSDNDKSLVTTYQDDFKSPNELSRKLQSLHLETSCTVVQNDSTDLNPCTTYRESFRWRKSGSRESTSVTPTSPRSENGNDGRNGEITARSASEDTPKARTNHLTSAGSTDTPARQKTPTISTEGRQESRLASGVKRYSDRARVSETSPVFEHGEAVPKVPSRNGPVVNGDAYVGGRNGNGTPPRTVNHVNSAAKKAASNVRSPGVSARQVRAAQMKSSLGGSPFAYGSDTETWV